MKTIYLVIFSLVLPWLLDAAVPAARVRYFNEHSGLSHRSVKQIAQDSSGYIWLATWNGLNRFDGNEFRKIKPARGDEARRYSDRIGDIKPMAGGGLLCRIDGKVLEFDTRTYKFTDLTSQLEKGLGVLPEITQVRQTGAGETVLVGKDGRCVVFADSAPLATARVMPSIPELDYKTGDNHLPGDAARSAGADLVYSGKDKSGNVWLITRDGGILCSTGDDSQPRLVEKIDTHGEKLYFCTIDHGGNIWLRSALGAYCVSLCLLPYDEVGDDPSSRVRALMRDRGDRIWMGDAGTSTVAICDSPVAGNKAYIASDGSVSAVPVGFGSRPYAIACDKDGNIWIGAKPGGVCRLRQVGADRYAVDNFTVASGDLPCDDVYDIKSDSRGRLWIATLGGGIVVVDDPAADRPAMRKLSDDRGYPSAAMGVRKLLVLNDTLVLAATRGGLLAVGDNHGRTGFRLHASEPDRESSLGNIATMDIVADSRGRIFVATESGGVDMLLSGAESWNGEFEFRHFNEQAGIPSDVSVAIVPGLSDGRLWVVSDNMIYSFDPDSGESHCYPSAFKGRKLRFTEGSPLRLDGNRWLVGHEHGCLLVDFDGLECDTTGLPVVFTSVSVQNEAPRLLSPSDHSITLGKDERNLTLHFSALDFVDEADILYEFRIDGGEWVSLGHERAVSFLDLSPGEFTIEVRSTDSTGRWLDNAASLNIKVVAKFHETLLFRIIVAMLVMAVIGAVAWVVVYIRRINARQRETLAAYLSLLDASVGKESGSSDTATPAPVADNVSGEDAEFMSRVMEFVNSRLSDCEVGVGDMAEYVGVSRSGLTRKLKSILGVTPSEFLKESRLSRAASLLTTTAMPIKDIAVDCGFSDLNYFGKCFKTAYGVTPTGYRREAAHDDRSE